MFTDDQGFVLGGYPSEDFDFIVEEIGLCFDEVVVDSVEEVVFVAEGEVIYFLGLLGELVLGVFGEGEDLHGLSLRVVVAALEDGYGGSGGQHASQEGSLDSEEDVVAGDDLCGDAAVGQSVNCFVGI